MACHTWCQRVLQVKRNTTKDHRIQQTLAIVILLHRYTTFQLAIRKRCQRPVFQPLSIVASSIVCVASPHFIISFWLLQLALFWFLHLLLLQSTVIVYPLTLCCCYYSAGINVCLPPTNSDVASIAAVCFTDIDAADTHFRSTLLPSLLASFFLLLF